MFPTKNASILYMRKNVLKTWLPYLFLISFAEWAYWLNVDIDMYNSAKEMGNPNNMLLSAPVVGFTLGFIWKIIVFGMSNLSMHLQRIKHTSTDTTNKVIAISRSLNFFMAPLFVIGCILTIVALVSFIIAKPFAPAVFFFSWVWGLRSGKYCYD